MRLGDDRSKVTETSTSMTGSGDRAHLDRGHDPGLAIQVPGWSGPMRQKPRSESGARYMITEYFTMSLLTWAGWEA